MEIIVALIGAAAVILAAVVSGIVTKKETSPEDSAGRDFFKSTGNLTDFFNEVTDEEKLEIEFAINEEGTAALFYNKTLNVHLQRIEYFRIERDLVFLSEAGDRRSFPLPLSEDIAERLPEVKKILMARICRETDESVSGYYVPFSFIDLSA